MKPRSRIAFVLALLAFTPAAVPASAQTVTLKYNWAQGDVATYRTVVRTNSSMTGMPGDARTLEQVLSQTLQITVAAVGPDGSATLRQVITAVSLEVDGPGGKVSYSSDRPLTGSADPRLKAMAGILGGMVGEAISVTVAPTGAIRRIDGASRIVDKLMADLPQDPMAGGLAQNIRSMLSDEALKSSLEQSFSRMPAAPVKIGDTWTAEQSVGADAIGKITGTSTFTLKAIEGAGDAAVARIGVALTLKQQDTHAAGASMVMKLQNGRGEGELLFQIATGRVERNTMRTDMTSTATLRSAEGDMTAIQNSTRTTMTMEQIKAGGLR